MFEMKKCLKKISELKRAALLSSSKNDSSLLFDDIALFLCLPLAQNF